MNVTAVLAIRNEEAYLANCLRHLVRNGVNFAIIDHGSSDASSDIYRRREFAANLVEVTELSFTGEFALAEQLRCKMQVIERLDADWVLHVDADEIMHSYRAGETLSEALARLAATACNVVNFDEFVFLPIEDDYVSEAAGPQPSVLYYFFQPAAPRLMRAWRKDAGLSIVEHGGHRLSGPDVRLADESLALRHYVFRSQAHAFAKYTTRPYARDELNIGWHRVRADASAVAFALPPAEVMKRLPSPDSRDLDRSEPWSRHYWQRTW